MSFSVSALSLLVRKIIAVLLAQFAVINLATRLGPVGFGGMGLRFR